MESLKVGLSDMYRSYERDANEETVRLLFRSVQFRRNAIRRLRRAGQSIVSSPP